MKADRLLALYDRVADAPDAVDRLRRFVLDLAVRGKLVEQDPADEPASELLKRIAAEKARRGPFYRARGSRLQAVQEPIESPWGLPSAWQWTQLDCIADFRSGRTPPRKEPRYWNTGDFPWISIADMEHGRTLRSTKETVSAAARRDVFRREPEASGTIIMSFKLTIGKVARLGLPAFHNEAIVAIRPHLPDLDPFLFRFLPEQARRATPKGAVKGATLNRHSLARIRVPLPPVAEQHRIVAKVDELMALCDQLEEVRTAREATRDRLTTASYVRLSATDTDSSTFRSHVRFTVDAFPALTTRAGQLKQLRQVISSLAFCGKLVEQDVQEGSGHDVHARLTSARKPSLGTGSLSKSIDGMYPLPSNWTWASLGQAIVAGPRNGLSPRSSAREDAPRAVTLTATTSGVFDESHFKRVDVDIGPDSEYWLQPNDLLFQRGNTPDYVGMAAIYNGPPGKFLFPDLMIRVRLSPDVNLRFVHLFCISPAARSYFSENAVGAQKTMPKINQAILRSLPIPLPPLAEQHRIVAKVDEFMALCDRLKAGLGAAEVTRGHLLDSLIHESLASHEAARIWNTLGAAGGGA